MLILGDFFKTQSDQNIHQTHQTAPYFQNFLGGARIIMLLNTIFCSRLFQNTHQNASIIKCF